MDEDGHLKRNIPALLYLRASGLFIPSKAEAKGSNPEMQVRQRNLRKKWNTNPVTLPVIPL